MYICIRLCVWECALTMKQDYDEDATDIAHKKGIH